MCRLVLCSVGTALALELAVKALRINHVAWSPATLLGALAFIVAVANVVYIMRSGSLNQQW